MRKEYNAFGKVSSYTRELESYGAELHGLMLMKAGAWEIDNRARVEEYCDNGSVVNGFLKMRK